MEKIISIIICFSLFFFCAHYAYAQKSKGKYKTDKTYKVYIPEEGFTCGTYIDDDDMPAVVIINSNLRKFKWKKVFGWYCSVIIDFKELGENGMPTHEESDFVLDYIEKIDNDLKGDPKHPNALFIARETKKGFLHAMWQVYNPEIANKYLQDIIISKSYPREMDFVIEKDEKWEHVDWFLTISRRNKV